MGATSGAGTVYHSFLNSPTFLSGSCSTILSFLCSVFYYQYLSFCPFSFAYCLVRTSFNLQVLITPFGIVKLFSSFIFYLIRGLIPLKVMANDELYTKYSDICSTDTPCKTNFSISVCFKCLRLTFHCKNDIQNNLKIHVGSSVFFFYS